MNSKENAFFITKCDLRKLLQCISSSKFTNLSILDLFKKQINLFVNISMLTRLTYFDDIIVDYLWYFYAYRI